METRFAIASEAEFQKSGGGWNHSAVFSNVVFALKSCCRGRFRLLASADIEIGGQIMTPAITVLPFQLADMGHDQLIVTQLPVATIEIDSSFRPFSQLIARVRMQLRAGVRSCWVIQPQMQCVFLFTGEQTYTFWQAPQTLTDPATGIELPLAPLFE